MKSWRKCCAFSDNDINSLVGVEGKFLLILGVDDSVGIGLNNIEYKENTKLTELCCTFECSYKIFGFCNNVNNLIIGTYLHNIDFLVPDMLTNQQILYTKNLN